MDDDLEHLDDGSEPARRSFKPGNVGADGDYIVGKNRPPEGGKFRAGDGRRRGRRPKGQRNFDTEFSEEAQRKVTIREGGVERKVSKLRSTIIRAFDNAGSKGQNQAIANIFSHSTRIAADRAAQTSGAMSAVEEQLLEEWLARRLSVPEGDPLEGPDPTPLETPEEGPDDE